MKQRWKQSNLKKTLLFFVGFYLTLWWRLAGLFLTHRPLVILSVFLLRQVVKLLVRKHPNNIYLYLYNVPISLSLSRSLLTYFSIHLSTSPSRSYSNHSFSSSMKMIEIFTFVHLLFILLLPSYNRKYLMESSLFAINLSSKYEGCTRFILLLVFVFSSSLSSKPSSSLSPSHSYPQDLYRLITLFLIVLCSLLYLSGTLEVSYFNTVG
jgi:hypothetical protein